MPEPSAPIGGDKDIEDFARERGVGQQSINKLRQHLFGERVAKTCEYDSGSMYGNQPLCDREATHRVTYFDGSYGPFKVDVCRHHVNPTLGRAGDPHGHGFTAETGG